eukprot:GILK01012062.1.p2 GENE.GILK01012062.1~~GILK01012062.1.p2  ORF type:complete len:102 (+),score=9.48 GILK01012062.1:459-764(+)
MKDGRHDIQVIWYKSSLIYIQPRSDSLDIHKTRKFKEMTDGKTKRLEMITWLSETEKVLIFWNRMHAQLKAVIHRDASLGTKVLPLLVTRAERASFVVSWN